MLEVLFLVGSYLAGSLPTGVLLARARGVDLRAVGSGNIGATNVARALGRPLGLLTLALDAGKGLGPVLGAEAAGLTPLFVALVGLAAVLGHVFPVWLRFHGGKGVATAAGVFLGLDPVATALAVAVYVLTVAVTRRSSVGSLLATASLPWLLLARGSAVAPLVLAAAVFVFLVWTHRDNLRRLRRGQEHRL